MNEGCIITYVTVRNFGSSKTEIQRFYFQATAAVTDQIVKEQKGDAVYLMDGFQLVKKL